MKVESALSACLQRQQYTAIEIGPRTPAQSSTMEFSRMKKFAWRPLRTVSRLWREFFIRDLLSWKKVGAALADLTSRWARSFADCRRHRAQRPAKRRPGRERR